MRLGSADWYDMHPDAPSASELAQDAQDNAECDPVDIDPEQRSKIAEIIRQSAERAEQHQQAEREWVKQYGW